MRLPPIPVMKSVDLTGWPALKKGDINKAMKEAYRRMGLYWVGAFLEKHFDPGAAARYGYEPRTGRYLRRKKRQKHHVQPLRFTGDLERQVVSPAGHAVRATKGGVTIKLRHHPVHRKVHQDLVRVTEGEKGELAAVFVRELASILNNVKARKRVRLRK